MSLPDVDERFDELVLELRATQLAAPAALRERVLALEVEEPPRRRFRVRRRVALAAVPIAAALAAAAALAIALVSPGSERRKVVTLGAAVQSETVRAAPPRATPLPAARGRAQQYEADLYLRVRDLSSATKSALTITRSLGGYVRSVHYDDGRSAGSAELVVRVPGRAVQTAILRFSRLGEIVRQSVDVQDVQPLLDARFRRMQALRRQIARLQAAPPSDAANAKLQRLRRELRTLQAQQRQALRRAAFATVALGLTTKKQAAVKPRTAEPTRLDRALDRAGSILLDEAVVLLYVLIVGGPIALIGVIFLAGGRAFRRRGEARLLERS